MLRAAARGVRHVFKVPTAAGRGRSGWTAESAGRGRYGYEKNAGRAQTGEADKARDLPTNVFTDRPSPPRLQGNMLL